MYVLRNPEYNFISHNVCGYKHMTVIKLNEQVINRLCILLHESGMNKKEFAREFGLSPSGLSELFSGRTKKLTNRLLQAMQLKRGFNPDWLETGIGVKHNLQAKTRNFSEVDLVLSYRALTEKNKEALKFLCEVLLQKEKL